MKRHGTPKSMTARGRVGPRWQSVRSADGRLLAQFWEEGLLGAAFWGMGGVPFWSLGRDHSVEQHLSILGYTRDLDGGPLETRQKLTPEEVENIRKAMAKSLAIKSCLEFLAAFFKILANQNPKNQPKETDVS